MREIQFRAWDGKTMWKIFDNLRFNYAEDDTVSYDITMFGVSSSTAYQAKNVILMQYTGLKDKNGKEIFEGDYIKSDHRWITDKGILVEWVNGGFDIFCDSDYGVDPEYCEVIGNIYENPELAVPL